MRRLLRLVGLSAAHYPFAVGALAGTGAAAGLVTVLAAATLRRYEVAGTSMRPTLEPGDRVVLVRSRRLAPGDVVVVADPRDGRPVVKRIAAARDGLLDVAGDNPGASTDSRVYGPVPATSVRGRVVYRYHPESRRGAIRRVR